MILRTNSYSLYVGDDHLRVTFPGVASVGLYAPVMQAGSGKWIKVPSENTKIIMFCDLSSYFMFLFLIVF